LEAEVTRKLAELQTLSEENEMLKLRSAVLEAVTSGREYHVSSSSSSNEWHGSSNEQQQTRDCSSN
jgi:hypothetical protein